MEVNQIRSGPTTITNTVTVGEDDTGHDVKVGTSSNTITGLTTITNESVDDLKLSCFYSGLIQSGSE